MDRNWTAVWPGHIWQNLKSDIWPFAACHLCLKSQKGPKNYLKRMLTQKGFLHCWPMYLFQILM